MQIDKLQKLLSNKNSSHCLCYQNMCAMGAGSDLNALELCSEIQSLAEMLPEGVESWFWQQPCSSSMMEIARKFFLGLFYFICHCISQLQRGKCFLNESHTILLKSYILKISSLILQILVMSLSSFKRRSFTMSYFEINMSIRIKYCFCINCQVCLGYYKLCFG